MVTAGATRGARPRLALLAAGLTLVLCFGLCPDDGAFPASAATLAFRLKPGNVYTYEVTTRITSEFSVFEAKNQATTAATGTVRIRVLGARQGLFILDVWEKENHTRRFLRPDGTVVGAPGEEGSRLPFFWTLPTGDWQPGQKHRLQKALAWGGREAAVPAAWELTLREIDAKTGRARIDLAGEVGIPPDRVTPRSITAKGTAFFNPQEGCFDQADWTVTYSLTLANKEIAVQRDVWKIQETRQIGFRLKGVTNE